MLGSEKSLPFAQDYLRYKIEAEDFIQAECKNIRPCLLRPGFIYNFQHRSWSLPLALGCNISYWIGTYIVKPLPIVGPATDFLFPAKSVPLEKVAHWAIKGALGQCDSPVVRNDKLINRKR